jgi:acyl-CoA thioesterase II
MITIAELLGVLVVEVLAEDRYLAQNLPDTHVSAGQLLAQSVVVALAGEGDKEVESIQAIYERPATPDQPLEIAVTRGHTGRSIATKTVAICQPGRLCSRSLVMLRADDADFVRHAEAPPTRAAPPTTAATVDSLRGWELLAPGPVELMDPDFVGPPQLDVWLRFDGAPADAAIAQALLAYAAQGYLVGTAMRPHQGVGLAQAHAQISAVILSQTVTFHESFGAQNWLLLSHRSSYAGRGRVFGEAKVFREDGQLVGSFSQESMLRAIPAGGSKRSL